MMPNQYYQHYLAMDTNFKSMHLHDQIHLDNPPKGHLILFSWGGSWAPPSPPYWSSSSCITWGGKTMLLMKNVELMKMIAGKKRGWQSWSLPLHQASHHDHHPHHDHHHHYDYHHHRPQKTYLTNSNLHASLLPFSSSGLLMKFGPGQTNIRSSWEQFCHVQLNQLI